MHPSTPNTHDFKCNSTEHQTGAHSVALKVTVPNRPPQHNDNITYISQLHSAGKAKPDHLNFSTPATDCCLAGV